MYDKMTETQQIRVFCFTQAAPLVMMNRQQQGLAGASVSDIAEMADQIGTYIRTGKIIATR